MIDIDLNDVISNKIKIYFADTIDNETFLDNLIHLYRGICGELIPFKLGKGG